MRTIDIVSCAESLFSAADEETPTRLFNIGRHCFAMLLTQQ